MKNDWEAYKKRFHELKAYMKELEKTHGKDGKDVVLDDLAIRLARQRAGISESVPYGE